MAIHIPYLPVVSTTCAYPTGVYNGLGGGGSGLPTGNFTNIYATQTGYSFGTSGASPSFDVMGILNGTYPSFKITGFCIIGKTKYYFIDGKTCTVEQYEEFLEANRAVKQANQDTGINTDF